MKKIALKFCCKFLALIYLSALVKNMKQRYSTGNHNFYLPSYFIIKNVRSSVCLYETELGKSEFLGCCLRKIAESFCVDSLYQ